MKQLVRTALYTSQSERIGRFFRLVAYFSRGPLKKLGVYGIWGAIWFSVFTAAIQIGYAVEARTNDTDAGMVAVLMSILVMAIGVVLIRKAVEKVIFVWRLAAANDVKEE